MTDEGRELAVMEKTGGLIIVKEAEYKGHALVDVRQYWRDESGTLRPTRKGLTIRRSQFSEFAELITEAAESLEHDQ